MGLLEGKRILVTGVLTDDSLAFYAAQTAIAEGAQVVLTNAGRPLSLTRRVAKKLDLDGDADVYEWDVTNPEHGEAIAATLTERWGSIDGALHSIAYAPPSCLGGGFLEAPWEDVSTAVHISAYSYKVLASTLAPLLRAAGGGSLVGLTFDATVAWPAYDWMGVAKAAFESCSRYLARELGPDKIRVNLIAAGPVKTIAAKSIPGFKTFEDRWVQQAPLGWEAEVDGAAVGRSCVALLSDFFAKTTGEIVHVDGGYHAIGA
jgi:enoyl ACP reductase